MAENTFILYNESLQGCIIDPGSYSNQESTALMHFIEKEGIFITHILLTHAHLDHVFGLDWACSHFDLLPFMHPNEAPVLNFGPQMAQLYGLRFKAYSGQWHKLQHGDTIFLGADKLEVIFVPGHSPGHVCFYCQNQNFVIGGDVLFQQGIGRTDLPLADHNTLIRSIKLNLFLLPEETRVYPGHGPATTIGEEKRNNPFLNGYGSGTA